MCSTPRPRTKITGKSASSASFLSSMSAESRRRFTEQANSAQARRDSIKMAKNKQKQIERVSAKQKSTAIKTKKSPPLSYWLLDASLTEIAKRLLLKKSKANY